MMTLVWIAAAFILGLAAGVFACWSRMRVLVRARNRAAARAHALQEENELLRANLARLEALGVVEDPTCLPAQVDRGIMRGIAYVRDRALEANQ